MQQALDPSRYCYIHGNHSSDIAKFTDSSWYYYTHIALGYFTLVQVLTVSSRGKCHMSSFAITYSH